jgi:ATP-dependent DNA helicase RecQ
MAQNPALLEAYPLLKQHWGYDEFRRAQEEVLIAALSGSDVLAILPTGGGKTLCFQLPALMREGCAIVVSPLIALMKDQVDDAEKRNIPASYINSHVTDSEQAERLSNLVRGKYKLFYIAPERIVSKPFIDAIRSTPISYIICDECHCISRWGSDFRPAYMNIHKIIESARTDMGNRPAILAVTATATADIEDDIVKGCGMDGSYCRIIGDPTRPNFTYQVYAGNVWRAFEAEVRSFDIKKGRYVVYAGTRTLAHKLSDMMLQDFGMSEDKVGIYHAGLTKQQREDVQDRFKEGILRVVIATNAFGMGIDIPDIRTVVHFGIPGSVEDYSQEMGRAGRDGLPARAVLLSDQYSKDLQQMFLDSANPPYAYYQSAWNLLHTQPVGHTFMLTGEEMAAILFPDMDPSKRGYEAQKIGGALSTMEAYGIVERGYAAANTKIEFECDLKHAADDPEITPVAKKIASQLLKQAGSAMSIMIDKEGIGKGVALSGYAVNKGLKTLADAGYITCEAAFRGKTCKVSPPCYGKNLGDLVDRTVVEAKRARGQLRLTKMLEYVDARDKRAFLREYFIGNAKKAEAPKPVPLKRGTLGSKIRNVATPEGFDEQF